MFPYLGTKARIAKYYPPPIYGRIIEPFCGAAAYSLRYWDRDVLLVDKYEPIIRIWKWLQTTTPEYILSLPNLDHGQSLDDFDFEFEEAKLLMGFIVTMIVASPRKAASSWSTAPFRPYRQRYRLQLIAKNLHKIRHWQIECGDYRDLKNEQATWFIDPPYQQTGKHYMNGNGQLDYAELAEWCRSRHGQAIVCEEHGAEWLGFRKLILRHGQCRNYYEMIWSNMLINIQAEMELK